MPYHARNDFNGDGRSDVLWQSLDGRDWEVTDWLGLADGSFQTNFVNADHHVQFPWLFAGIGDFNGDGKDDILWTGPNYLVGNWLGQPNGGFISNFGSFLGQVGPAWTVRGIGDFNGDGRADVLWQEGSGQVTDWLGQTNGGFVSNFENAYYNPGSDWVVAGIGDFNGDGRDDILWRNNSGAVTDWLGQPAGGFVSNIANSNSMVDDSWRIVGTGDFNGDGRDDVLWKRDSDGLITDWLAQPDGSFISNFVNASHHVGSGWSVAGIGDYNGDRSDDILWRNTDGEITDWLAQPGGGFASNFANFIAHVDPMWTTEPHYF